MAKLITEENPLVQEVPNKSYKIDSISGWGLNNGMIYPIPAILNDIPPGLYTLEYNAQMNRVCLCIVDRKRDDIISFKDSEQQKVLTDIALFWELADTYYEFGITHKRSVLLHGAPGCGKTSIIGKLVDGVVDLGGLAIQISESNEFSYIKRLLDEVKAFDPFRKIILIIEDIDCYINGQYSSFILNILDGGLQYSNFVTVATTNYPDSLQERFVNRPGRFNLLLEVKIPNFEIRKSFFAYKFKKLKSESEIIELANQTEGFTMDHIRELFVLIAVNGMDEETAIDEISKIAKTSNIKRTEINKPKSVGFKN